MPLQPWFKVVPPREDLRDGKPLDAAEFAVHLDHVRDGRAPADYQKPERFFGRIYLTRKPARYGDAIGRWQNPCVGFAVPSGARGPGGDQLAGGGGHSCQGGRAGGLAVPCHGLGVMLLPVGVNTPVQPERRRTRHRSL